MQRNPVLPGHHPITGIILFALILYPKSHTMRYILILLLFAACSKNNNNIQSEDLKGKWVEQSAYSDTLSFENSPAGDIVKLWRKTTIQRGVQVPFNPMLYRYKVKGDSISIELPSGGLYENFNAFYFNKKGDIIMIGNFYDAGWGNVLSFKKL